MDVGLEANSHTTLKSLASFVSVVARKNGGTFLWEWYSPLIVRFDLGSSPSQLENVSPIRSQFLGRFVLSRLLVVLIKPEINPTPTGSE
jgi:hypothetical protein